MTGTRISTSKLSLIGFIILLALAWFCYRPALDGDFQLDDMAHLAGLASVNDARTATDFVLTGSNSPLGRQLAMLTFALQADDFAAGAGGFLRVNVFIHLFNALLLAWCLYQLAITQAVDRQKAVLIATSAAGLWVLLPLNATASLLVVQRMTTLSAMFSLAGLGSYLAVRGSISKQPRNAMMAMTALLALATLLAAFTKESGLLLPMFVLVLESTILSRPDSITQRHWAAWRFVVLVLPSIAILLYLASRASYPDWMQDRRGFNAWQRLLTESQILWVYLKNAVIGLPGKLGIFQSEFPIARSLLAFNALASALAWLGLAIAAIIWRRSWPLFAFAVLWFLAGHALESTVLPLELYFEHRNYLPMIGPLFALCMWLLARPSPFGRAALIAIPLGLIVNAYFLYVFASMWGEPSLASRYWALRYPDSVRAVTRLASYQLIEEGPQRAIRTLHHFAAEYPDHAYLHVPELNLLCQSAGVPDLERIIAEIEQSLANATFTYTAGSMLSQLFTTATQGRCEIGTDTVRRLATALQQNDRYINDPYYSQFHHKLLAGIARYEGDQAGSLAHLRVAISHWPTTELNMMMVTSLAGAGDFSGADDFIDNAMLDKPVNPLKALAWRRDLESLRTYVRELEKHDLGDQAEEITQRTESDKE
ncbi:MAG: hypothetical protein OEM85_02725 [Gammaproteobacteria bacterium]|nr:hypothetical protein [Gammaproteobacteria bacterium]